MEIHDLIVRELFDRKSLAALIYLIDFGRELEFRVDRCKCFISHLNSDNSVYLSVNGIEQRFDSVSEMIKGATIEDLSFLVAWEQAELEYLF